MQRIGDSRDGRAPSRPSVGEAISDTPPTEAGGVEDQRSAGHEFEDAWPAEEGPILTWTEICSVEPVEIVGRKEGL